MQRNNRLNPFLILATALFAVVLTTAGCTQKMDRTKGVYMLLDTSGTYTEELTKARAIVNYLLGSLAPGDTMAVARIDTASVSARRTFSPKSPLTSGHRWPIRKSALFKSRWPNLFHRWRAAVTRTSPAVCCRRLNTSTKRDPAEIHFDFL